MPHPDDESYAFGGLLAVLADLGVAPTLVSCTALLGSPRHGELVAAWGALGLPPETIICGGLPDAGLDHPDVTPALSALLARHTPRATTTAVCVLGPEGVYGHRDHTAVWRVAVEAFCAQKAPVRLVWPVFADSPGLFDPLKAYLRRVAPSLLDPTVPEPPPPHSVHASCLAPDIQTRKRQAIGAHASQLPKGKIDLFLGRGVVDILSRNESFAFAEAAL